MPRSEVYRVRSQDYENVISSCIARNALKKEYCNLLKSVFIGISEIVQTY